MTTRLPITCTVCEKSLTGGLDTFSDIQHSMCWDCHSSLMEERELDEPGLLRRLIREESEWLEKHEVIP